MTRAPALLAAGALALSSLTALAKPPHKPQKPPSRAQSPVAAAPEPGDEPTRAEILTALSRIEAHVQDCYDRLQVAGLVVVKMVVAATGRVLAVESQGPLAGTPSAACVEDAVRSVTFRPFKRDKLQLTSQFVLKKLPDDGG